MKKVLVVNPMNNDKIEAERIVDGIIVKSKNNAEYGSLSFSSVDLTISGGFVNKTPRTAFLGGSIEDLQETVKVMNLTPGKDLENHEIVIKESVTPFYEGQDPKLGKSKGSEEFDRIMTHGGAPIYRKYFLVAEGSDTDTMLTNDSVASAVSDEIEKLVAETQGVK